MLDYDKKFLLKRRQPHLRRSSIRGFSQQAESDLRLEVDWPAFYWLPSDIFGPGKSAWRSRSEERDGSRYAPDMRSRLKLYAEGLFANDGTLAHASNEIEGFLFRGRDAERQYHATGAFEFISTGGYYHSLPATRCAVHRQFGRGAARPRVRQREDHPEAGAVAVRDELLVHRGLHRGGPGAALQTESAGGGAAARHDGVVPAEAGDGRQRQRHAHEPLGHAWRPEPVHDAKDEDGLSDLGWSFIDRILANANDICLILNSSVNSYRRLDPHFEAPNQIKASAINRGADGADPARQREVRARRSSLDRA